MPRDSSTPPPEVLDPFLRIVASLIIGNQRIAERLGLGMTDMQFLTHLRREGAITPGRLAELTGLSSGTVTGVLDRLEAAGFARRERDATDRRRVLVHLDEERLDHDVAPLYATRAQELAAVYGRFDEREQATIVRFLEALADAGARER